MTVYDADERAYERHAVLFTVVLSVLIAFVVAVPHLGTWLDLSAALRLTE